MTTLYELLQVNKLRIEAHPDDPLASQYYHGYAAGIADALTLLVGGDRDDHLKAACNHEWVDIRNEVVKSGEMCRICYKLRPGNEATGAKEGQNAENTDPG